MKKITIRDIQKLKGSKSPFATVTAYDFVSAQNADAVDFPLLLVCIFFTLLYLVMV